MSTDAPLLTVQQGFQSFVMNGVPGIDAMVAADDTANAETRLAVYFNAYRLRLVEVLGNDYPALKIVLGDSPFDDMAHAYLHAHPSETRSIRWVGRHLPEFLRTAEPYVNRPVLSDLAEFEWRRGEVFDERDSSCVTMERIAELAPEYWPGLRFLLIPAMRRLKLEWNAPAIGKAVGSHAQLPEIERSPGRWLLWRQDLDVYWRSLDAAEATALDAVSTGASFAEICEGLTPWAPVEEVAQSAASLLKRWAVDGLIAQFQVSETSSTTL